MAAFHILGQGLAGCALAWTLHKLGVPFTIEDRGEPATASRIAAGLMTPITGKRFAVEPEFDEYFAVASCFYKRVETIAGSRFFEQCGALRLFQNPEERSRCEGKPELRKWIAPAEINHHWFLAGLGGIAFPAARLNVAAYLEASRRFFEPFSRPRHGGVVIDCTGIAAPREGRLPLERFQQAKGEILALRIPGLAERRTIHHGLWLAHWRDDLFRAGATYSWNDPDDSPSEAGRNEIETRLKMFLKLPFETVGHHAATRPIAIDRKPIVERLANGHWALNGLGSKGALLAPRLAQQLAEALRCGG